MEARVRPPWVSIPRVVPRQRRNGGAILRRLWTLSYHPAPVPVLVLGPPGPSSAPYWPWSRVSGRGWITAGGRPTRPCCRPSVLGHSPRSLGDLCVRLRAIRDLRPDCGLSSTYGRLGDPAAFSMETYRSYTGAVQL